MRMLVLAPVGLDEKSLANRAAQSRSFAEATGTEFEFRGVNIGPLSYDDHQDWLLAEFGILEAGCSAEADGFDAVCVDTLSDAGVSALRSALNIPVFGAGQPAYLLAMALGRRFSILTQWEPWFAIYEKGLREYGLRDNCVSMRSVNLQPDLQNLLGGKIETVLPLLQAEAEKCIGDGADVIVLGSTTMHEAHSYLSELLPVPVVNPGPASYALAHGMHVLGAAGHSRIAFKRSSPDSELLSAMAAAGAAYRHQRQAEFETAEGGRAR